MDIQLCVVTGQPLANLIPVLQEKPDRVALVVSGHMQRAAGAFRKTLAMAGLDEGAVDLYEGLSASNYDSIVMRAMEIEEDLKSRYPGARIIYNATGGNKLMALGFMSVFGEGGGYRVIYADTRNHQIEVLQPRQNEPDPMQSVLNLDLYLKAEGKTIRSRQDTDHKWRERAAQRKPATRFLAEQASKLEGLVTTMNRHYAPDNDGIVAPSTLTFTKPPRGLWLEALKLLEAGGVLEQGDDTMAWLPRSMDCATYLSGAWLEEYVWHTARDAGAEEVALSLTFTDDFASKEDLRNEVDVAILHRNQLLLVECKTGNFARDGKDQDIIYKLDSLVDQAGGALGQGLLVSYRRLEHVNRRGKKVNARARAGSVDLYTCESEQLGALGQKMRAWLETMQWPAD